MTELNDVERRPNKNRRGDWFYVDQDHVYVYSNDTVGVEVTLSTPHLLRVLDKAGILARWDAKQKVLMPKK